MAPSASEGFLRTLHTTTALGLAVAAGGGVLLTLAAVGPDAVEVIAGRGPGVVTLLPADAVGGTPFTEPFAVELRLDQAVFVAAPAPAAMESPHRRHSEADIAAARDVVPVLSAEPDLRDAGLRRIEWLVTGASASVASVGGLEDRDGDGRDDDGRVTVGAFDGSAVCITLGPPRHLAEALGVATDFDGIPASGVSWSPDGPCGQSGGLRLGSELRFGTTPGTYGASAAGEVCDIPALRTALEANPVLAESWAAPLGVPADDAIDFVDALTAAVLLTDTAVTDHELRGDRVASRQAILQRGTAVLVDPRGAPAVRCMSGAPLRSPQMLPADVAVEGKRWPAFRLPAVARVAAGDRPVQEFIMADVRTGLPLRLVAGSDAARRLAGPIALPPG